MNSFVKTKVYSQELAVLETAIITNKELPANWTVVSDPELVKFGDRWWMFFNSIQLDFDKGLPIHVLAASLPKGAALSSNPKQWTSTPKSSYFTWCRRHMG